MSKVFFLPTDQAWSRYLAEGGYGDRTARAVVAETSPNLVILQGLPGYWWRKSDLVMSDLQETDQTAPSPVPAVGTSEVAPADTLGQVVLKSVVPVESFYSSVVPGDLVIVCEAEVDEDCTGEDCESCGGEGCWLEGGENSLSAVDLLRHLLKDYDNNALSFAEYAGVSADSVDDMYRDLLKLVQGLCAKPT